MKYLFLLLILVHSLIHVMGFAKAFKLASFDQLRVPISPFLGLVWLAAALLLMTSAVLLLLDAEWWWAWAGGALLLSQLVIFTAWSDAKWGTLANLVVLGPVIIAALGQAPWGFHAQYRRDVAAGLAQATTGADLISEADLAHLPPSVQRYLRFAGVVGQPRVYNYHLELRGALREGPDDAWMPIVAEQQSFVAPAERLFLVDAQRFGLPVAAYHRYIGSEAVFEVNVASLVTVVDAHGPEMDRSETVTLFNDMCLLAPATLLDPAISWEELDPQTVRATFTNAGHTITALLSFAPSGALTNFVSDDRARTVDGTQFERARWSTPVSGWRRVDGRPMPDAEARWELPTGEFAYARFEVLDVNYNVAAP